MQMICGILGCGLAMIMRLLTRACDPAKGDGCNSGCVWYRDIIHTGAAGVPNAALVHTGAASRQVNDPTGSHPCPDVNAQSREYDSSTFPPRSESQRVRRLPVISLASPTVVGRLLHAASGASYHGPAPNKERRRERERQRAGGGTSNRSDSRERKAATQDAGFH